MIKNIIFDIGNVLAHFRWREYIEELGITGNDAERVARATVLSPYWSEIDRGVMSVNEIIKKCVETDKEAADLIKLFYKDRRRLVMEYDYSADWIRELKNRGYGVFILSNFNQEHYEYISKEFNFLGLEDGRVISGQEKCLKPEEKIYRILLDRYKLKAEECVFLDDSKANIEGAEKIGIHGILFTGYDEGRQRLEELLKQ